MSFEWLVFDQQRKLNERESIQYLPFECSLVIWATNPSPFVAQVSHHHLSEVTYSIGH